MKRATALTILALCFFTEAIPFAAAENLRLNPRLDYSSDSHDGPLITGKHLEDSATRSRPNNVFMFGEG